MIGYKTTTTRLSVVFFLNLPPQPLSKPLFLPSVCEFLFFGLSFLALVGYWSAVPLQLGAESERAPCPAPVPPRCHRSIPNICLFFSFPMQASPPHHQKYLRGPVLDGPGAYSFWSGPLPTCSNVFVCLSHVCPHFVLCLKTAHFFFPAIPHPRSLI